MEDSSLFSISDEPIIDESLDDVPCYTVGHVYDLNEESNSSSEGSKKPRKSAKNCCWNCGGAGHSLRLCPEPQNQQNIAKNRAQFASRSEFKRYHLDLKEDSYNHLKPGVISDKLRDALGLKDDQLPEHIYRMRTLGYPPGWLLEAEAKLDSSGIEMFDNKGNRVPNADEEDGEIGGNTVISMYDESKIISYPGFNEWPAPGTLDETDKYRVPQLNCLPSKEEFLKSLNSPFDPAVRNSFNQMTNLPVEGPLPRPADSTIGEEDMETEDLEEGINFLPPDDKSMFVPPLPEDDLPPPPPEEGEVQSDEEPGNERGQTPPGVTDVEEAKTPAQPDMNCEIPFESHGRIVSIELGTPAIKIHSPFSKLPPPEAFKKDISDVINFENLPDSTGTYEKLKGVLKNVRTKMSKLKDTKMNATI